MASISVELLVQELSLLINQFEKQEDEKHQLKLIQLKEKLQQQSLSIALCGHFSAGKSTLINTLCEAKLLPSSPIPTSANVVTLGYSDEAQAVVEILHHGQVRTAIVPIEQLSDYCVDGESYTSVKISYPSTFLKQGITLLDTPGIDSTDDAHRMSTESALHLADVVFYMMDYNHVQSEINFSFAKQLKEWGKPLYFIVNQIDKHRDEELSFESYRQSVWDAFHAWHLEPAGIIYLSLKRPEHKEHEWNSLMQLCRDLVDQTEQLKLESVKASLKHIVDQHIQVIEHRAEEKVNVALQHRGGIAALEKVLAEIDGYESQKAELENEKGQIIPQFRQELEKILKNAMITPAQLRDKVALFLESRQPGFKQGFLFTKAKTEAEQQQRLNTAYEKLVELIQSNIVWHIQQAFRTHLKPFEIEPLKLDSWLNKIEACLPKAEWLVEQISSGAIVDQGYTLTYCAAISDAIKRIYKEYALSILEDIINIELAERYTARVIELDQDISALKQELVGSELYFESKQKQQEYKDTLQSSIHSLVELELVHLPAVNRTLEGSIQQKSFVEQREQFNLSQDAAQEDVLVGLEQVNNLQQRYKAARDKLLASTAILNQAEQLSGLANRLQQKADRLDKLNFTISLFGAFSAGKSSLANALIGDAVLPVSPNPTTAAINSILPPDELHPHNTATIYMKTEQSMLEDLIYSLKLLGLYSYTEQVSKEKLFELIDKIKPSDIANAGRAHYSFVKAARMGWSTEGKHLGQSIEVNREQYEKYVAEEALSCFVQEIKFYYACPLTASGIVLVDTPGADSVNARHTGVAFNFIKNTDAIIFVTYYNHAFSHADRQFLDQLGRVKDQFELDKMFFIVNAADLASSSEELKGVLKHVENNLEAHKIVNPRLYPVSSIYALEAKQQRNMEQLNYSGMQSFEQQFYAFIQLELGEMVLNSAQKEYEAVYDEVNQLVSAAKRDAANKDSAISKLIGYQTQLQAFIEQRLAQGVSDALLQEVNELTYYIVQRLQLRFTDFYNYAINPAAIKDEGLAMQHVLYTAWLELERTLAVELKQELLATTLRIEKHANRLIEEQVGFVRKWLAEHDIHYKWEYTAVKLEQPQEHEAWALASVTSKWLYRYFKSAKHFFEQKGKQQLRAELEPLIFEGIKHWMAGVTEDWKAFYTQQYSLAYRDTLFAMQHNIEEHITHSIKLLDDETYMTKMETVIAALQNVYK